MYIPVECISYWLSTAECNYSAMEHKFVATISSLKYWRHYLVGKPCAAYTDHMSLKCLILQLQLSRQHIRCLDFLSQFDLQIEYVLGKQNMVANAWSNCPDLAGAIEVQSDLLVLICASQIRDEGIDEWNCIKLDAKNGRYNMIIYEGLVCCSYGADFKGPNALTGPLPACTCGTQCQGAMKYTCNHACSRTVRVLHTKVVSFGEKQLWLQLVNKLTITMVSRAAPFWFYSTFC